ncbi:O-ACYLTRANSFERASE WSD1-LIKE ISOFORM X1 [Salix koriyanagi]|uniref:diacylglycerol O-acyltransferase n=1 Tax=Salix koriyanagi TaxID=2511006 RepID=A0A9Q1AMY3_9ROSI|nr:O-ACYLTRANSFERASE WSD1-LIKE ISOFORM X1 [Salix koriyanagi]
MAPPEGDSVEPVTPAGRLFLQPEMDIIIHCAIGFKNKIDIDSTRSAINNSLMLKHPRLCSLLVRDKNGREHWKKTDIDIDQHFIIVNQKNDSRSSFTGTDADDDADRVVNEYIADLSVSTPLDISKPLWEVHVLLEQNCAILRIHHALGDGISLTSLFLATCRTAGDPEKIPTLVTGRRPDYGNEGKQQDWGGVILRVLQMTVISGGDGVELWPRKLATAKFLIEDMRPLMMSFSGLYHPDYQDIWITDLRKLCKRASK